jgi:uncharacterized membrane protein
VVTFETRTTKWLAIALTASLGVNMFLAGVFVGRWVGPPPIFAQAATPRPPERPVQAMLDRMAAALDEPNRTKFEVIMDRHRPTLSATGTSARESRRRVGELMAAEPFDRAKLETALQDLRERNMEFQRTLHAALTEVAAGLPPEARQKIAAASRPRSEREQAR